MAMYRKASSYIAKASLRNATSGIAKAQRGFASPCGGKGGSMTWTGVQVDKLATYLYSLLSVDKYTAQYREIGQYTEFDITFYEGKKKVYRIEYRQDNKTTKAYVLGFFNGGTCMRQIDLENNFQENTRKTLFNIVRLRGVSQLIVGKSKAATKERRRENAKKGWARRKAKEKT